MGRGKLGEAWRAPNASWGVTGADWRQAGFGGGFQGAARQADTPRLATGAYQQLDFVLASRVRERPGRWC